MARSKKEDVEWESHRPELKALYQRLTVDQIREYMSERYGFSKSNEQYTRQFTKWSFKKNLTGEDWKFIAHRREKRKREGKDPGTVQKDGNVIPEPKVRKAIARHVLPTAQYLDTVNGDIGPPTPEGIVVGTPKPEVQGAGVSALQPGWLPNPLESSVVVPDIGVPTFEPATDGFSFVSPIDISELFTFPTQQTFDQADLGPATDTDVGFASMTTHVPPDTFGYCDFEHLNKEIAEGTGELLSFSNPVRNLNDLSEFLEPITMEYVHSDLIRKAKNIFQSDRSNNLSHYLSLCVYLSSNNLLSPLAMNKLVALLAKTKSQVILGTLLQSPSTTTEIFMSNCLASAAELGEIEIVRTLIDHGVDVDVTRGNVVRRTPLSLAIGNGNIECVRLLIENGSDLNPAAADKTPIQIACDTYNCSVEMVQLLLESGAYVNPPQDSSRLTALQLAVSRRRTDIVRLLLQWKADPNTFTTSKSGTALQIACRGYSGAEIAELLIANAAVRAENITMTRMLLSAGAHVDARPRGKYGHTALQIAAMVGNQRLVRILLLKDADIDAPASVLPGGLTALQAAAEHSDTEILSFLVNEGADVNAPASSSDGRSALRVAIARQNIEAVRILLDAGASVTVNENCKEGLLAVQESIRMAKLEVRNEMFSLLLRAGAPFEPPVGLEQFGALHAAVYMEDVDLTERLLKRGANPNIDYWMEYTPLQRASYDGNEALVKLLISYRADINAPAYNSLGQTALQAAVSRSHTRIVKILLDSGANVRAPGVYKYGNAAMGAAIEKCDQDMVQMLLDLYPDLISSDPYTRSGALRLALRSWECNASFLKFLIEHGAVVNDPPDLKPSLQIAAEKGNFEVVQCLLSAGAGVNHRWVPDRNSTKVTALQAAVSTRNIDIVRLLLKWGANASAPANPIAGGKTALQIAVSMNYFEMVQVLVESGADINGAPSPQGGRTALQEAASSGYLKLTQYLLQRNADVNAPAARFNGITALQGASINGNIRIAMMLLAARADINAPPALENGRTAIEGAAENGRLDTLHLLLNFHPYTEDFEMKRKRAVKLALANGHLAIGRFLMAYRKSPSK
ncbi:ankyrin repeat protein [Talaromyces pinophilus]|uniref:Ankyrin repeat protein n=1 Tax=Talaromyces pinophilus TaxID=128442 RepID=A0A6V8H2J6_TALPI|nr:ankyrin repeat protein [Talaromyces pinophilus]